MPRSTMAMEVAVLPTPGVTLMILAAGAVVSAAVGRGGALGGGAWRGFGRAGKGEEEEEEEDGLSSIH